MPTAATSLLSDLQGIRLELESLADPIPVAASTRLEEVSLGGRRCLEVAPPDPTVASILYVHGGAFCLMRADLYTRMAGYLALATKARVLIPDYRLPPEHPYPAPSMDVLAAYEGWINEGDGADLRVLAGDSAGANLALSAVGLAHRRGVAMPSLVVLFSPWLDLTLSGQSIRDNAAVDEQLDPGSLATYAGAYAGAVPVDHPELSPRAVEAPFPPLLIQAGAHEILLDDARALAASAAAAGVDATLQVEAGMQHNYQFWGPLEPAAMRSYEAVAATIQRVAGSRVGVNR